MGCDKDQSCLNSRKRVICSVVIQSELIDESEPLVTSFSLFLGKEMGRMEKQRRINREK